MTKVSKNIKKLRMAKNMSQDDLAKALFISRQAVSSWEVGRTQPDIGMVEKLAELFDVPMEEVIYGAKRDTSLEDSVKAKNTMSVFFAVLGSLFVGTGLIIVLLNFWDDFSSVLKTVVAILPILIGQGIAIFTYLKKKDSLIWREGAAVAWSVGIIASVGLMSFVHDIALGVFTCLFIDAVFILPILFLFKVTSPIVAYFLAGIAGAFGIASNANSDVTAYIFLGLLPVMVALGILYIFLNRKELEGSRLNYCVWLCVGAVVATLFLILNFLNIYTSIVSVVLACFIALYAISKKEEWVTPFYPVGVTGTMATLLLLSFENFGYGGSFTWAEFKEAYINFDLFFCIALSIAIIAVGMVIGRKTLKNDYLKLIFCAIAANVVVFIGFVDAPVVGAVIAFLLLPFTFAEGVVLIVKGIKNRVFYAMNVGIITLLVLMYEILMLVDLSLIGIGLIFLVGGGSLLGANIFISKLIKKEKAELALKAVEDDE